MQSGRVRLIVIILVLASIALVFGVLRNRYKQPKLVPPSGQEAAYPFGPGDHDFSLEHGGLTRTYSVHVPPFYDGKTPTAAVITLHGGGGDGRGIQLLTQMNGSSDKYGFIGVYPDGTGTKIGKKVVGSWNAGRCCPEASKDNVDDVGFVSHLIDDLKTNFNIDQKRIYATGHSNGSQMSFRLACQLSDKIAAIASAGAQGVFDNCVPERPVPVMYFHGTSDNCSPYNGGIAGGCFDKYLESFLGTKHTPYTWSVDSVPQYMEKWKEINKVSGSAITIYQKGNAVCEGWGINTNGEVVLCTIKNGGHTWPGGTYGQPCVDNYESRNCKSFRDAVGIISSDIIANDAMWEFFKRHPMR